MPLLRALAGVSKRAALYLGLFHGKLVFGANLSWMWNIFGLVSIALWAMLACFTAITSLVVDSHGRVREESPPSDGRRDLDWRDHAGGSPESLPAWRLAHRSRLDVGDGRFAALAGMVANFKIALRKFQTCQF